VLAKRAKGQRDSKDEGALIVSDIPVDAGEASSANKNTDEHGRTRKKIHMGGPAPKPKQHQKGAKGGQGKGYKGHKYKAKDGPSSNNGQRGGGGGGGGGGGTQKALGEGKADFFSSKKHKPSP
jgi:hypothetical protein